MHETKIVMGVILGCCPACPHPTRAVALTVWGQTGSIGIPREHFRNANSQALPQTSWIRRSGNGAQQVLFSSLPGDSHAYWSLRTTTLECWTTWECPGCVSFALTVSSWPQSTQKPWVKHHIDVNSDPACHSLVKKTSVVMWMTPASRKTPWTLHIRVQRANAGSFLSNSSGQNSELIRRT